MTPSPSSINGAQALVRMLENHGVTHIFGIPGAKIDSVFIALLDSPIKLILCRHEQNAVFMAAAMGRMTGKVGVCLVTSGPGVSNLVTGICTATTEGDPVLAIGGEVPLDDRLKRTHQSLAGVDVLRPVTKYAAEVITSHSLGEIFGNAIRAAESGRPGAAFIALPKDIGLAPYPFDTTKVWGRYVHTGNAAADEVRNAAEIINRCRRPILLLGLQASQPSFARSLKHFIQETGIPYVSTFQGPGAWAQPIDTPCFAGRLGLFKNQPGDRLLDASDCVITIGFDPIEYDPSVWNTNKPRSVICMDIVAPDQDFAFLPQAELIGDIGVNLEALLLQLNVKIEESFLQNIQACIQKLATTTSEGAAKQGMPVHPLRVIHELRQVVTDQTTIALDVGSNYIWMNRYFPTAVARQVLVSNGQQTLGVALPWAIAANLARPGNPVISISGDGGFLFSSMELETAMRIKAKFVHLIWNSASYDMVAFQEQAHYAGKTSGVALGTIDVVAYATAFGCRGIKIQHPDELANALCEGLASEVPMLIDIPIDYSENMRLMEDIHQEFIH